MHLLSLASQHRAWLAARQTALAENIANANTPHFRARTVPSFSAAMEAQSGGMALTHGRHLEPGPGAALAASEAADGGAATHSGNSVRLEQELMAAGAVRREYSLNVSVVKTFRRMLTTAIKG